MSKKKIMIASRTSNGKPGGDALMPIVEFCLERGGKIGSKQKTAGSPFNQDRDGYYCYMLGPTTLQDVLENFELPDHFEIGVPTKNCIWARNHAAHICFTTFEQNEVHMKEMKGIEEKYAEKRAARRKRIQERKRLQPQTIKE